MLFWDWADSTNWFIAEQVGLKFDNNYAVHEHPDEYHPKLIITKGLNVMITLKRELEILH